jgi:hypothetical protein
MAALAPLTALAVFLPFAVVVAIHTTARRQFLDLGHVMRVGPPIDVGKKSACFFAV